jgi:ribosomal protein L37E
MILERGKTYVVGETPKGERYILCTDCGMASYNNNDIEQKYCGMCNEFHSLKERKLELEDLSKKN